MFRRGSGSRNLTGCRIPTGNGNRKPGGSRDNLPHKPWRRFGRRWTRNRWKLSEKSDLASKFVSGDRPETTVTFPSLASQETYEIPLENSPNSTFHNIQPQVGLQNVHTLIFFRIRRRVQCSAATTVHQGQLSPPSLPGRLMSITLCKLVTEVTAGCGRSLVRRRQHWHLRTHETGISTAPSAVRCARVCIAGRETSIYHSCKDKWRGYHDNQVESQVSIVPLYRLMYERIHLQ